METEAQPRPAGRPRPWLLAALALVAGMYLVSWLLPGKSAAPAAAPSKPRVTNKKGTGAVDPSDLEVRLEALKRPRPEAAGGDRNPFRFYSPPVPAAPVSNGTGKPSGPLPPPMPAAPPGPPLPPPIPLKYFGFVETPSGKVAAFSDCRVTMRGREGDIIDFRYRLVRIGVESVVMEYRDGRGRTTIRMSGQDCVGK